MWPPTVVVLTLAFILGVRAQAVFDLNTSDMEPLPSNYCNNSDLLEEAGLIRATMGQFLGFECSEEFYHCRWQSDGYRTYRKKCKTGLVYDVLGTQNCNYDYNVKSCGIKSTAPLRCNGTDFHCALSEECVPMSSRCDGHYDCAMEEDEQNCPLCTAGEFACIVSEQCIPLDRRCNGIAECSDDTDERDCDVCGHGLFHCGKSGECVSMDERCDGRRQCPHGEDELLCKKPDAEKKFTCQSRDFDIPFVQVCDGKPQCPDGSDEAYCDLPKALGGISFSSNPNPPELAPPPQPPIQLPPTSSEATEEAPKEEEEYEYEETEMQKPSFPMLSLIQLPATKMTAPPAPTTRTTPRPPPPPPTQRTTASQPPRPTRPAFSRPKPKSKAPVEPKIQSHSQESVELTTHRHNFVHPTLIEVTAPAATPSTSATKRIRYPTMAVTESRRPSTIAKSTMHTRAPTAYPTSQKTRQVFETTDPPKEEKVFVMQVTASPRASSAVYDTSFPSSPSASSSTASRMTSTTRAASQAASQAATRAATRAATQAATQAAAHSTGFAASAKGTGSNKEDILRQINNQLNGGMSPELLSKIEKMLTAEMGTQSSAKRRKPSDGLRSLSPATLLRTFVSRVQDEAQVPVEVPADPSVVEDSADVY